MTLCQFWAKALKNSGSSGFLLLEALSSHGRNTAILLENAYGNDTEKEMGHGEEPRSPTHRNN